MTNTIEQCENCGRVIGKLESPHIYRDSVVCGGCYTALNSASSTGESSATDCPRCHSRQTQKLSMVYATGTRTGTAATTGAGFTLSGDVVLGGGATEYVDHSHAARMAAPPAEPKKPNITRHLVWGGAMLFVFLVDFLILIGDSKGGSWLFGLFILAVGITILYRGIKPYPGKKRIYEQAMRQYEADYALWNSQFMCMKCGHIYVPRP